MTQPNEPRTNNNDPSLSISGFEDLAIHLSHEPSLPAPKTMNASNQSLPAFLERTPQPPALPISTRVERPAMTKAPATSATVSSERVEKVATRIDAASMTPPAPHTVAFKVQQLRAAAEQSAQSDRRDSVPELTPILRHDLPHHERFHSDPRDDVLLRWAEELPRWWHFDVEARMVEHETLWIMEKAEEIAKKYLKPIWWDRFVEGINDFCGTIYNEVIRPVWSLVAMPLAALAELLPDIDWPWNFELRGAHVSVKQTPLRRIVFDNRVSPELVDRLWNDPDAFIDAGQSLKRDDRTTVARVPLRAPGSTGQFPTTATGVLKRFHLRDLGHTLSHMMWFTRASRAWVYGREMLESKIGTARPLAMVEERVGPCRFRSYVLTEHIEGTRLDQFLQQTRLTTTELDQLAAQFAHIWHTLGEMRIGHGDMKASNFIVTPDRQLKIIDLDGTWRHWFDVTFLPRRDRDWLRFMKNWKGRPEVGAAFRAAVARHFDDLAAVTNRKASTPVSMRLQRAA